MSKVISDQIEKTQLLLTGLNPKVDVLKDKGIDDEFINKLEANNALLKIYNEELDLMKADLKAKTIETNKKIIEIKTQMREAKRVVKHNYLQHQWGEFGITDKR